MDGKNGISSFIPMNLVPHLTRGRHLVCLLIDKKLYHISSVKTCSTADPNPLQAGAGVSS